MLGARLEAGCLSRHGKVKGTIKEQKYDVVAVNLVTRQVRFMARSKSLRAAEAIVDMAVARRGVDKEFFADAPAGDYADGDTWRGHHTQAETFLGRLSEEGE